MDAEKKLTYVFDLDNTICDTKKNKDGGWDYLSAKPFKNRVNYVNKLFDDGHQIIVETARGCVSKKNWYEQTYNQLIEFGLKFHQLRTGIKFNSDYFIDDKGINSESFFNTNVLLKSFDPYENEKKINLFCEIFFEANNERLNEYVYCINKNINNQNIKKIYLVCYEETFTHNEEYFKTLFTDKLDKTDKITLILDPVNKRFLFNNFVEMSKKFISENEIVAVTNLDIFFPDDNEWKNVDKKFFIPTSNECALALSRTEYINDNYFFIDQGAWERGEFADAWVFKTPLKLTENSFPCDIPVGSAPSCDNYMFYIMNQEYKEVFNWADKYKIFHYDLCRKPESLINKSGKMILHDDVIELDTKFLQNLPENMWKKTPFQEWESILNKIKLEKMGRTTININDKNFYFEYYDFFDSYYANNGVNVEPQTRKWFLENIKEDDIVFDIGSHIGLYTILFSEKTKNVHSFEPTQTYDDLLKPNIENNKIKNVNLHKLAFGSESGKIKEKIYKIWGMDPFEDEYEFTTIDDYTESAGISPTILKIDVDGFDYEVLIGGSTYLKNNDVTICIELSEIALATRNNTFKDIVNFLSELGYVIVHIFDNENYIFKKK